MAKVKHPVLTAVCRSGPESLSIDRVAALDPGGGSAVDVLDLGVSELEKVAGGRQAALAAMADGEHRPITRDLANPLLQLAQRNELRAGHMPGGVLPWFSNVQQERLWLLLEALSHPIDVNARNSCHRGILTAARPLTVVPAQAWPPASVELSSVSKGQQYLQFFGSDTLKRLHGCAIAESDRGTDSPCQALARPLRRPQVGFGNPQAPIVFISPSPLDVAGASNEAFAEWLDREATLEHHLRSETPHPYFQFIRAVMSGARRRLGQKPGKHDSLDLAFHTWAVRCATGNPDRVTDDALNQCVDRHLDSLMASIAPRVVIAMGGPVARHLWWRTMRSWDGWGPMTTLHGRVLEVQLGKRTVPAILSVHPYQRGIDLHPDVIAHALGERIKADELQPQVLKAA